MTNELKQSKNLFRLNMGLNTEMNELNFADGFTTDEENYELLVDGTRRRRKGLAAEASAGAAKTIDTLGSGFRNQAYVWENVGGNPDKNLLVFRTGDYLYFADADEIVSNSWYSEAVFLDPFRSDDATDALVQKEPLSFTQGRGLLFVSGQYIKPFYVSYDSTGDDFSATSIEIRIRDFTTIDDGTTVIREPTGTISADHRYNLRNRGWNEDDMGQYFTDKSKHPARNSVWFRGYKRVDTTSGVLPEDGTRTWDSSKIEAEAFGPTSAPVGSLFLDVHDTTTGFQEGESGGVFNITTWAYEDNGANWEIKVTTDAAHGLTATDTFDLIGLTFSYTYDDPEPGVPNWEWIGYHLWNGTLTAIDSAGAQGTTSGTNLVFNVTAPSNFVSFTDQYRTLGTVDTDASLARSTGTDHGDSFRAVEFHAGRVWYAGMKNTEFNDRIMFSQIIDDPDKSGFCFQEADPTSENFNAMVSTDGGYVTVPGMGGVLNMVSVRDSLLILAKSGVWEVTGARGGIFLPDAYTVRQITHAGCTAAEGFVKLEDALLYTGPAGIMLIAPNQYTGVLEATNVSENTIQTLWNQIADAEQQRVQIVSDEALKRIYIMYGPDGSSFAIDTMLIWDVRAAAWFKYTFDAPTNNVLMTGFAIPNADDTSDNKKMKFIYEVSTTSVQVADFDQTSFDDWDGTNGPLPYMFTSFDYIGDHQRRKQAPVVTVYNKRTNTGYTQSGDDWIEDNPASTKMTAYWDWTDNSESNKIGTTVQTHRDVRQFVASAADDEDGYPVVVTRNKVRGRGRNLRLKFEGEADKDSHLMGYTLNYKVTRKV